jgi:hypothetical protein
MAKAMDPARVLKAQPMTLAVMDPDPRQALLHRRRQDQARISRRPHPKMVNQDRSSPPLRPSKENLVPSSPQSRLSKENLVPSSPQSRLSKVNPDRKSPPPLRMEHQAQSNQRIPEIQARNHNPN